MTDLKQFISQLTDKLRDDAELQMDVAQELQTHLDEAADECRAAGMSEQQAIDHAIKAMGNPQELADQLFQANRRRMKLRALARWAAGAALLPAAIATIILLATLFGFGIPLFGEPNEALKSQARNLPEDKQLLLAVPMDVRGVAFPMEQLKAICDRWPTDPVYYACYVTAALPGKVNAAMSGRGNETNSNRSLSPETLSDILELLDKGERLEPDNAYYNVFKAAFLFSASSTISEDQSRTYDVSTPSFNTRGDQHPYKIDIKNPTLFQQGLKEFRLAASKQVFTDHELDLQQRQMDLLPPARHIRDIIIRALYKEGVPLYMTNDYRRCFRTVDAYALSLAGREPAESLELLGDAQQMNLRVGSQTKILIQLLVANSVQMQTLATQRLVHLEMNQPELAAQDRDEMLRLADIWTNIRPGRPVEHQLPHVGLFWSETLPDIPEYQVTFEPMRTAEGITLAQVALLGLLASLVLITLPVMMVNLVALLKGRRGMMVFVGWRRIGRICLWAIVVPLLTYGAYYAWQVYNPDALGLNFTAGRVVLEMLTVLLIVLFLLVRMSHCAIRQRCEELGLPTTRGKRWSSIAAMGLLVAVVLTYVIGWWVDPPTMEAKWADVFPLFQTLTDSGGGAQMPELAGLFSIIGGVAILLVPGLLIVLFLLVRDLYRRTRDKCEKSGQSFPARKRWPLLAGMGLVIAITAPLLFGVVCWLYVVTGGQDYHGQQGLILAGLLLAVATVWGLLSFVWTLASPRSNRDVVRTYLRSIVPILCAAVIVVGIFCGGLLAYAETSAARRVVGPADLDIKREVDASALRHLRDYFAQQLKSMPAGASSQSAGSQS